MMALAGGIAAIILGIIGLVIWWADFLEILKGTVPFMFVMGGALAAYLGYEEIKDKKAAESLEDSTTDLKQEVDSLKKELEELKKEKEKQAESKEEEKKTGKESQSKK